MLGLCRGHGTQVLDGQLLATEGGFIERVNKLISVRPLRQRYILTVDCQDEIACFSLSNLQCLSQIRDTALGMQMDELHLLMPASHLCRYSAALGDIVIGRVTEVSLVNSVLITLQLQLTK